MVERLSYVVANDVSRVRLPPGVIKLKRVREAQMFLVLVGTVPGQRAFLLSALKFDILVVAGTGQYGAGYAVETLHSRCEELVS